MYKTPYRYAVRMKYSLHFISVNCPLTPTHVEDFILETNAH